MENTDVINNRLDVLEITVQQMYTDKIYMQEAINTLGATVYGLKEYIDDSEKTASSKVEKGDVFITDEQAERLKKALERVERSNGDIDQSCEHEWIKIPVDGGIFVGCPKCKSVDVEETKRLSRGLSTTNEG
ncbi:hypothetical protein FKQ51_20215 [Bacillus toyonensis]|uniref:hypothetical protein n=1 Tax=Bacillus toyonensis TaxID=155322 RepID=UPI002709A2BA|nr:hypothetical protein [Bacillus toyonensis]MDO8159636.1 hypothetical protein [Bacillus toyonensis]